jgi:hypothetical protein
MRIRITRIKIDKHGLIQSVVVGQIADVFTVVSDLPA